jgi:hypothetical protein
MDTLSDIVVNQTLKFVKLLSDTLPKMKANKNNYLSCGFVFLSDRNQRKASLSGGTDRVRCILALKPAYLMGGAAAAH